MPTGLDSLGEWRRTHYSTGVIPQNDGLRVTIFGWVSSIRSQAGIIFVMLSDKEGIVQLTLHRDKVKGELLKKVESLSEHTSIGVRGVVKKMTKAPRGAEVIPEELKVLGVAKQKPAFTVFGGSLPSVDKRLDIRAVDLRREKAQAIFAIQRAVVRIVREFLTTEGFLEVRTPKLIASASEGGAALFSVLYYNRPAFLTQSPQLYKEQLVLPFEKVFEIGPAFRAEESRTQKHLSEITSIDIEEAFVDYRDTMDTLERLTSLVSRELKVQCRDSFKKLKRKPVEIRGSFKRMTYDEALRVANDEGQEVSWGEDIAGTAMEKIGHHSSSFYFITDWPTFSKPFYIKPKGEKPKLSESFDLMYGSVEVASGGSRVNSKELLTRRLKEQKLKPQAFEYHLRVFDYGMPPHAGFGLGLERLMMALTGEQNIREVTLYPRDKLRIVP